MESQGWVDFASGSEGGSGLTVVRPINSRNVFGRLGFSVTQHQHVREWSYLVVKRNLDSGLPFETTMQAGSPDKFPAGEQPLGRAQFRCGCMHAADGEVLTRLQNTVDYRTRQGELGERSFKQRLFAKHFPDGGDRDALRFALTILDVSGGRGDLSGELLVALGPIDARADCLWCFPWWQVLDEPVPVVPVKPRIETRCDGPKLLGTKIGMGSTQAKPCLPLRLPRKLGLQLLALVDAARRHPSLALPREWKPEAEGMGFDGFRIHSEHTGYVFHAD